MQFYEIVPALNFTHYFLWKLFVSGCFITLLYTHESPHLQGAKHDGQWILQYILSCELYCFTMDLGCLSPCVIPDWLDDGKIKSLCGPYHLLWDSLFMQKSRLLKCLHAFCEYKMHMSYWHINEKDRNNLKIF